MTRKRLARAIPLIAALVCVPGVAAYLQLGTQVGANVVAVRWTTLPIPYYVTIRDVPGVNAGQLQTATQQAFSTWAALPSASLTSKFVGFTGADPFVDDGLAVIGFLSRPDLDRVLGATRFEIDPTSGAVRAADIFLNSSFPWSTSSGGDPSAYDVQSIVTHELGHLHGLSHSALGETNVVPNGRVVLGKDAVMFPIAYPKGNILDRTLKPDDIAGMSDIYPNAKFLQTTGQITGRVTLNGAGVYGAHIVVFNPATSELVGGFSLTDDGRFVISGLVPGAYVVRAEPLDDADLSSFFDDTTKVNLAFKPAYYGGMASVPAGGAGKAIEIAVTAK